MAPPGKKKKADSVQPSSTVVDYRFSAKRTNIPPAGLAAQGRLESPQRIRYEYDPHRPPVLRFDAHGAADRLPELIAVARDRALTDEEAQLLASALRNHQPWLEWAGKRERRGFEVEPVALHIHERIAAQAIVKVAARQDVQRDLFADPKLSYRESVQFYQHDVDWANRMILGDSLQVMASLARRENLAGRVQMIYIDPPYGIKFASNFQPEVGKRDVKDKESDLTREPEMVKAYRDTWTLGVHSYLAYLRDRLMAARDLLADSGSIFVQISDENLHRVRAVMDDVFGAENFVALVPFKTTGGQADKLLPTVADYLLWYARSVDEVKYRQLYAMRESGDEGSDRYGKMALSDGSSISREAAQRADVEGRPFRLTSLVSQGFRQFTSVPWTFNGAIYDPGTHQNWKTTLSGLDRLAASGRIGIEGNRPAFVRYLGDFPVRAITTLWTDTQTNFAGEKRYVVQTATKVIERCLLMTTDPGDLVLDPTCGSGTTAYVAEQWGRRWITMDTSRVALALARQRLMTAKFDYFELRPLNEEDRTRNPNGPWLKNGDAEPKTLNCQTVPHVTLRSIAQNSSLDGICSRHQAQLDEKLKSLNTALSKVGKDVRATLAGKLAAKQKSEGKKAVTEGDRRRWLLPPANRDSKLKLAVDPRFAGWYDWEVPFDTDPDWPKGLQSA